MRPRETPHTSTPIAGAQTSQAHRLNQDHEPPASCRLSSWPAAPCRGSPAALLMAQGARLLSGVLAGHGVSAGTPEPWRCCNAVMEQRLWPSLLARWRLTLC